MRNLSYILSEAEKQGEKIAEEKRRIRKETEAYLRLQAEEEIEAKAEIAKSEFRELESHKQFFDLHFLNLQDATTFVDAEARRVSNSKEMACAAFIHGKGWHSCFYGNVSTNPSQPFDDEDFGPILKPAVRAQLDRMAAKFNCKCIYGEDIMPNSDGNEGIVLFMNKPFYELYISSKSSWSRSMLYSFGWMS